jgi:choline dehydrogenase-like flavoprotein
MNDPRPSASLPKRDGYDVVIVGAGVVGAIMAKELAQAGKTVLLLEAGRATSIRPEGYESYVETYQRALAKTPNSPYPPNPNAPHPSVLDQGPIAKDWPAFGTGEPLTSGYHVYKGPRPFYSTYTKTLGGTTLHFLGTCIRMVPDDFRLRTEFDRGIDWPFGYDHLMEFYELAELEMGVSADVREGTKEGVVFREGYEYPMQRIPPSYLDRWLKARLKGVTFGMGGEELAVQVVGTPAGRNGMPNPRYTDPRTGHPYRPSGAPYDSRLGQRCEGNSACVPICPVMAKYNALRTLYSLDRHAAHRLEIVTQAVASRIELSEDRKRVTGISCKLYDEETVATCTEFTARGKVYVVAAHAIESAKLLLASGAAKESGQLGCNLMDHPYLLTWGLAPEGSRLGVHRGPQITSEIPMRTGAFRKDFAAFRADIRNCGWDFAAGAPYSNVDQLVFGDGEPRPRAAGEGDPAGRLFGKDLRNSLRDEVGRQISFGFQIEQLPDESNRITIDPKYMDRLGNHRPVIEYDICEYTRAGMQAAYDLSAKVFTDECGGLNCTDYKEGTAGSIDVNGKVFEIHGSGHVMGTHRMGAKPENSVVNADQRTWDHHNLFLVGCGNMPTVGTSNPTLTIAALAFKAARKINEELG